MDANAELASLSRNLNLINVYICLLIINLEIILGVLLRMSL